MAVLVNSYSDTVLNGAAVNPSVFPYENTTTNLLILVLSWFESVPSIDGVLIDHIDFNGSSPLLFHAAQLAGSMNVEIWFIPSPPIGADITITWGGDTSGEVELNAAVLEITGSSGDAGALLAAVTATANNTVPTADVAKTSSGGLVVAALAVKAAPTITADAGETEVAQTHNSGSRQSVTHEASAATGGTTVTMNWTLSAAFAWNVVAFEVVDAALVDVIGIGMVPVSR